MLGGGAIYNTTQSNLNPMTVLRPVLKEGTKTTEKAGNQRQIVMQRPESGKCRFRRDRI